MQNTNFKDLKRKRYGDYTIIPNGRMSYHEINHNKPLKANPPQQVTITKRSVEEAKRFIELHFNDDTCPNTPESNGTNAKDVAQRATA